MPQNKILVVDDEKLFQSIYKSKLLSEGYQVKTAGDGTEAIKILSEETFDLILLDLNNSELDVVDLVHSPADYIFSSLVWSTVILNVLITP